MNTEKILMYYEMFDAADISTERLLAMTADAAGCDVDDVVCALAGESNSTSSTSRKKRNRKRRKRN